MTNKPESIEAKKKDDDLSKLVAKLALDPAAQAAITLNQYHNLDVHQDLGNLHDSLSEQTNAIKDGDLDRCEEMLAAQAHSLDAIFNCLAQKAIKAESMSHLDNYLRLALKAQSQCRTTLDSLSGRKSAPMIGYVQQANIANGPQQVNNGVVLAKNKSKAKKSKNKLMEKIDGERLDTRATCSTIGNDQELETMGPVYGSKNTRRQEEGL